MPRLYWILPAVYAAVFAWSAAGPNDYFTWVLEVAPGVLILFALVFTFRRFKFTALAYVFALVHCVILFVGAKYTYAEVPFFDWIRDALGQSRNNYDKVGHFAQGFIPAIFAREIFIRLKVVNGRRWLAFLTACVCMTVSAVYEIIEWLGAVWFGKAAEAFLGTQGYIWDTQSDMLCALTGAVCMLIFLSGAHDRQIAEMGQPRTPSGAPMT